MLFVIFSLVFFILKFKKEIYIYYRKCKIFIKILKNKLKVKVNLFLFLLFKIV